MAKKNNRDDEPMSTREIKRTNGMKSSAVIKCSGRGAGGSKGTGARLPLVRAGWSAVLINVWP